MAYLASPPLVVAYALAGTMDIDLAGAARHGQRRHAGVPGRPMAVARRGQHGSWRASVAADMFTPLRGRLRRATTTGAA